VTELMKQKQYSPMSIAQMALVLYCANEGYLTDIETKKVLDFEAALLAYAASEHADLMQKINDSGDWNDDLQAQFKALVEKFKSTQTW